LKDAPKEALLALTEQPLFGEMVLQLLATEGGLKFCGRGGGGGIQTVDFPCHVKVFSRSNHAAYLGM